MRGRQSAETPGTTPLGVDAGSRFRNFLPAQNPGSTTLAFWRCVFEILSVAVGQPLPVLNAISNHGFWSKLKSQAVRGPWTVYLPDVEAGAR
jgi:hypothetical protein